MGDQRDSTRFSGWPLTVEFIDGHEWRVARDIAYCTQAGEVSTVRAGFVFDFASIVSRCVNQSLPFEAERFADSLHDSTVESNVGGIGLARCLQGLLRSLELVGEFFEIDLGFGHVEGTRGVPR